LGRVRERYEIKGTLQIGGEGGYFAPQRRSLIKLLFIEADGSDGVNMGGGR